MNDAAASSDPKRRRFRQLVGGAFVVVSLNVALAQAAWEILPARPAGAARPELVVLQAGSTI